MFNYKAFLEENFKTPKGLLAFLAAYGADTPNGAAAEKWFQRGAVPGNWLPVLLAYLELDNGSPKSIVPYLVRRK